ncbi:MAG: methylenetetrahydrofolate reductase [Acidimicrobiales bacterium]
MSTVVDAVLGTSPSFSVELWPPRNPAGRERLAEILEVIQTIRPDFVSVTYGAGGSTRERTFEMVRELQALRWSTPVAHLTCIAHTSEELTQILQEYLAAGVTHLLALRGDPPLEAMQSVGGFELHHAIDLLRLARSIGPFTIAVAVHPEGHPEATSRERDRDFLAEKLRLSDFGITQFYFDSTSYREVCNEMADRGVTTPIVPGVMVPASFRGLTKMAALSGASIPAGILARFEALESDPQGFREYGLELATKLAATALADGAPGVHLYSMNSAYVTDAFYRSLY